MPHSRPAKFGRCLPGHPHLRSRPAPARACCVPWCLDTAMPTGEPSSRGTLAASLAAVASALAAVSCCLPLGPFLLALGSAGASGIFVSLQPYLIAFAVLMLVVGIVQAFRTRR